MDDRAETPNATTLGRDLTPAEIAEDLYFKFTLVFDGLKNRTPSRENSLSATKLEEAMMWFNKDRANKGEIKKSETHVH